MSYRKTNIFAVNLIIIPRVLSLFIPTLSVLDPLEIIPFVASPRRLFLLFRLKSKTNNF